MVEGKGEILLKFFEARFLQKLTEPASEWTALDKNLNEIKKIIPDNLIPFFIIAAVEQVLDDDDDSSKENVPRVGPFPVAAQGHVSSIFHARSPTSLNLAWDTRSTEVDRQPHGDNSSGSQVVPRPPLPGQDVFAHHSNMMVAPSAPAATSLTRGQLLLVSVLNFLLELPTDFLLPIIDPAYDAIVSDSDDNFDVVADLVFAQGKPLAPYQAQALQKRFMQDVKNRKEKALRVNRALAVFMDRPDGEFFFSLPVAMDKDFQRARAIAPYITDVCFVLVSDNILPPGAWRPTGFLQKISQVSGTNAGGWGICNTKLRTALDTTVEMKAERTDLFSGTSEVILTKVSTGDDSAYKVLVRTPNTNARYSVTKDEWNKGIQIGFKYVNVISGTEPSSQDNQGNYAPFGTLPALSGGKPDPTLKYLTMPSLDSETSIPLPSQSQPDIQTDIPMKQKIQNEIQRTKDRILNAQWIPVMLPASDTAVGQALMVTLLVYLLNTEVNLPGDRDTNVGTLKIWTRDTWAFIAPSVVGKACTVFRDHVGLPPTHAAGLASVNSLHIAWASFFTEFNNPRSFVPHILDALKTSICKVPAWAGLVFIALCRTAILLGANRDDAMIKVFAKKPGKSFNALLLKLEEIHRNHSDATPSTSEKETAVFSAVEEEESVSNQHSSGQIRRGSPSSTPPYIKILQAGFGLTGEARAGRIEQDICTLSAGILGVTPVLQ